MSYRINTGILLMIFTAFLQSAATLIAKITSPDVSTGVQVLFYYLIPLLLFVPRLVRYEIAFFKTDIFIFYLLRGVFSALSVFCLFYASQYIELGLVAVLFNTTPIFIPILASLFLKEKTSLKAWLGILIAALGVIIVLHPHSIQVFSLEALIGLLSGFLMALSQIMLRHVVKKHENIDKVVFYQYITSAFAAVVIIAVELLLSINALAIFTTDREGYFFIISMLVFLGVLCFIGQRVLAIAFRYMPASLLAPILYFSVPLSSLAGWFLWQQKFTLSMIMGTGLIVVGICIITIKMKLVKSKKEVDVTG